MKVISSIYSKDEVEGYLSSMVLAVLPINEYQLELKGNEKKIASELSEERRAEFTAGRNIARMLLGKICCSRTDIDRTVKGAPIWPDGICGSISHKQNYCAVLVGNKGIIEEVGVDLEFHEELSEGVWKTYTTEEELSGMMCPQMSDGEKANLVFSAKEAAFKCFSTGGKEIPLEDIRITAKGINSLISISCEGNGLACEGVILLMNEYVVACVAK